MTPLEIENYRTELLASASSLAGLLHGAQRAGDRAAVKALAIATTTLVQLAVCPVLHILLDQELEEEPAHVHDA